MPVPVQPLAIDARPSGPHGPLAAHLMLGRPVLQRLLEQARAVGPEERSIAVHARAEEHDLLEGLIHDSQRDRVHLVHGPPAAGAAVLRTDRLYDLGRLRRAVRHGWNLETAVLWRLDHPRSLACAEEELIRRLTYQPLGRYWAFPLAERLAAMLELSPVRPNGLTLLAAGLMLAAAAVTALGQNALFSHVVSALALAAALVLDTADGRLARLQGTGSPFGRWLDQVLDELADLVLHAAIAWSAFRATASPTWLVLGMLYASGKHMFVMQSLHGEALNQGRGGEAEPRPAGGAGRKLAVKIRRAVELTGHADVRWHLWIVLALLGRLDLALLAYAIYFPLRALGGGMRKAVARG